MGKIKGHFRQLVNEYSHSFYLNLILSISSISFLSIFLCVRTYVNYIELTYPLTKHTLLVIG